MGDSTIHATVLLTPPHTTARHPALATPAPTSPPISACDEEDGMPATQVMTFHAIAPPSAPKITLASTMSGSIIPLPTVCATLRPNTAKATKLNVAAHTTA